MNTAESTWRLFVDGASRNNPGPAGIGVYLVKGDQVYINNGWYIGHKTNNQAEYIALIIGLYYATQYMKPQDYIMIYSDSELLVKQLHGTYKVKNQLLRPLYEHVKHTLQTISYDLYHVIRKHNTVADALANYGINNAVSLPEEVTRYVP